MFPWQFSDPWPNVSWSVVDYKFRSKLASKILKIAYAPILPLVRYRRPSSKKAGLQAIVIVHNATRTPFRGTLHLDVGHTVHANDGSSQVLSDFLEQLPVQAFPERSFKAGRIAVPATPGTVIRLRLANPHDQTIAHNFSFPAMEPPQTMLQRFKDHVNLSFDTWWRKYMVKLMELDRQRKEVAEWRQKKTERERL